MDIMEFHLDQMVEYPHILIIGKNDDSRNTIINSVLDYYIQKYNTKISVICPADKINPYYITHYENTEIHCGLQEEYVKKFLHQAMLAMSTGSEINAMFIFNDCIDTSEFWNNKTIDEILMNGRHYKIPYIITMERATNIPPAVRMNFDYVFVLPDDSVVNRRKIWNNYGLMIPTFGSFENIFNQCTRDNHTMVINNRIPFEKINYSIYWYRARNIIYTENDCDNEDCEHVTQEVVDQEFNEYSSKDEPALIDLDNKITEYKPFDGQMVTSKYDDHDPFVDSECAPVSNCIFLAETSNPPTKNTTIINFKYHDENCDFALSTDSTTNSESIIALCENILTLKNMRLEYMRLVNENMKLQLELKKLNN